MKNCAFLLAAIALLGVGPAMGQAPKVPSETVIVPAPKITDKVISDFVAGYAKPALVNGKLPEWYRGICPDAVGLGPAQAAQLKDQFRKVAELVGAPIGDDHCSANVLILVTTAPQALLDDIALHHQNMLGSSPRQSGSKPTMSHSVQAYYSTSTRDYAGVLRPDNGAVSPGCGTGSDGQGADADVANANGTYLDGTDKARGDLMTRASRSGNQSARVGNFMTDCNSMVVAPSHIGDGVRSEMSQVTIIVDGNKVGDTSFAALTDYLSMLVLSQTGSFDTCRPIDSISNLLAPDCPSPKDERLTSLDIAYLKALYNSRGDALSPKAQRAGVVSQMKKMLLDDRN